MYDNFTQAQKCWVHLLRKAIKLTLVEPTNVEFRGMVDALRQYLNSFTLQTVIDEIQRWNDVDRICFVDLARKLKLPESDGATLDRVIPRPSA